MFKAYWSDEALVTALQAGAVVKGTLRINPKNYENSYVLHPSKDADILICGMSARNRAFNGDQVAVCIKPKKEWRVFDEYVNNSIPSIDDADTNCSSASPQKGAGGGGANARQTYISLKDVKEKHPQLWKTIFLSDSIDLESNVDPDVKSVVPLWWHYVQRTGEVVAITQRIHQRRCVGTLRAPNNSNNKANFTLFSPFDSRVPRLIIPRNCWPQDFAKFPEKFKTSKFIARVLDWPDGGPYAKGELLESLENLDLVEMLTKEILVTSGIESSPDFSETILNDLPSHDLPIEMEEINLRKDLRHLCIFTIDPSSARDLDDAIHYRQCEDGNVEIGVHIADVSHYVRAGSELDKEAQLRSTTVYLVDRIIPMLPRSLCEHLCTLTPGQDKLSFSVLWIINPDNATIISTEFCRSIIRSCAKLSYNDAQACLDNPQKLFTNEEFPPVESPFTVNEVRDAINKVALITRQFRKQRFTDGALRLDQPKLSFKLSEESKSPIGFDIYHLSEANWLIEELMLLANMSVAQVLYQHLPDLALLRRHEQPDSRVLAATVHLLRRLGYHVDGKSSGALQKSLDEIKNQMENIEISSKHKKYNIGTMQLLVNLCSKCMKNAEYICSGCVESDVHCHHYALNVPLYTHFTSPIRRYADVVVHRQLSAILNILNHQATQPDNQWLVNMNEAIIADQADRCNIMKKAAKEASEKSAEMFYSLFVKECGPFQEDCLVFNVLDRSFDVIIISCGLIKRVYCELLELEEHFLKPMGEILVEGDAFTASVEAIAVNDAADALELLANDINAMEEEEEEQSINKIVDGIAESAVSAEERLFIGPTTAKVHPNELVLKWPASEDCPHRLEQIIKCQDLVKCSVSCRQVNDTLKMQIVLNRPNCSLCV